MSTQKYIDVVGNQYVEAVTLVDSTGVPYKASGGGMSDTVWTDDNSVYFIIRDNGTLLTYIKTDGTLYTPGTNIRPYQQTGGSTSANQLTEITRLTSLLSNQPALNGDGGSLSHTVNGALEAGGNLAAISVKTPVLNGDGGSLAHVTNFPTIYQSTAVGYSITQTVVAVGTTSSTLIAANPSRKYLSWMVVGTADITVSVGTAVVGVGQVYQASGINKQGSSEEFPYGTPVNAFQAIAAAAGSNMIIWEGV